MPPASASRPPCHREPVQPLLLARERFITPLGWGLLAASLLAHALLLALLPMPHRHALDRQHEIRLSLKDPPPPPPREPEPELPKPEPQPQAEPEPQVAPPLPDEPAPKPAAPGPVIGVPGDGGPGAVYSGTELPSTKEPPTPPPTVEPPPARPEPKPQPKPAPPTEPPVDVKALLAQYAAGVKAAILAQKYYPPAAERLGHSGNVKVSFTLDAGGGLAGVSVKSSSGFDELDSAALDAVRRAAPFGALPAEVGRDELSLSITLKYTIE
jgi:periplasmic protein TonB